jgi:transposase
VPFSADRIELTSEERDALNGWVRAGKTESRLAERAKVILLAASGMPTRQIAKRLSTRWASVSKWRRRFAQKRLEGLQDKDRSGKPAKYDKATDRRVLELLDQPPPEGYSQWNGPRLAEALGDVSRPQVWRVLRRYDICLERRRSWCVSTDPEFGPKAADIVGLYLNPPENALVLCVDEKPSIQVLERAQGWLRLPNGKALNGFSHGYKRHGTTTLFAALDIATGQVLVGHYNRRRRREFLDFMNRIVKQNPDREIHVVVDNLNTHKPKRDRWLARHPNVHFHFTPTYSSWLNQVEVWFSILMEQALKGLSLTRAKELRDAIDRYVNAYNPKAAPFEWTKAVVHPVGLKPRYADLCN